MLLVQGLVIEGVVIEVTVALCKSGCPPLLVGRRVERVSTDGGKRKRNERKKERSEPPNCGHAHCHLPPSLFCRSPNSQIHYNTINWALLAQEHSIPSPVITNSWSAIENTRIRACLRAVGLSFASLRDELKVEVEEIMTETMPESFVESVTGVTFPSSLTPPGSSTKLAFAGAGVREKRVAFINVKVYAVALYVESGVKAALESWRGQPVLNNSAFFNSVLNAPVQKALQLVLVRDITGSQFWGALDEALRPRLRAAKSGEAGEKALAELAKVFQMRPLSNGTTITLNWVHPSTLQVGVASNPSAKATLEASIDNKALVSSIFDIYVGDQPISPGAKSQFAAGLARFV